MVALAINDSWYFAVASQIITAFFDLLPYC